MKHIPKAKRYLPMYLLTYLPSIIDFLTINVFCVYEIKLKIAKNQLRKKTVPLIMIKQK